jgi:solute carrier family 35 protein F5
LFVSLLDGMMRARLKHCWNSMSRRALGLLCLAGVVVIWVVSAETIQFIFRNEKFRAPFFLTYFNTSLFSLYLLGFLFRPAWWGEGGPPRWLFWLRWSCFNSSSSSPAVVEEDREHVLQHTVTVERFTLRRVFFVAFWFCPLWFGANYFYNLSLTLTSASSSSILSSSSSLFTLGLGLLLRVETGSIWKLAGVLLTVGGVVLVSLVDTSDAANASWVGDVVALLGAIAYACYAVYLKV